ncbi:MAG: hypothetical protein AB1598_07310 [Thermodesulfobacteriota bacterium]
MGIEVKTSGSLPKSVPIPVSTFPARIIKTLLSENNAAKKRRKK